MGFGSVLGGIAGGFIGGPAGASIGSSLGGLIDGAGAGDVSNAFGGYAGRPPRPEDYIAINLPGVEYPSGFQTVDFPNYPDLPMYDMAPVEPYNKPLLPIEYLNATQGEQGIYRTAGQAEDILNQLLNPDSQLVKKLGQEETQLLRMDRARAISDLQRADRREKALGREGVFGGERGAENLMRAIQQGAQETELQGRISGRNLGRTLAGDIAGLGNQYARGGTFESGRADAYRGDLAKLVEQMRGDVSTRTSQQRYDYNARLRDLQNQLKGRYASEVDRLKTALDRNPTNNYAAAQNLYQGDRAAYEGQRLNALGGAANDILGAIFKGGTADDPFDVVPSTGYGPQQPNVGGQIYGSFF